MSFTCFARSTPAKLPAANLTPPPQNTQKLYKLTQKRGEEGPVKRENFHCKSAYVEKYMGHVTDLSPEIFITYKIIMTVW